ncbi:hypothetical protein K2X85_06790 [bacterium]|nr:hypothetical protein [bacterium]
MNWCMLLVAASVASPWEKNNCRSYYWTEPTPVYVTCQPTPSCTYPSTMVCGPVVAEICEEVKTEPVKAEEPIKEASAEEEGEETTEFTSFGVPAPFSGGDLALDWGTASIGAGTLYPQQPYAAQSGGFFPWGRGNVGSNGSGDVIYPNSPTTIINNIINNYGRTPDPIPEPASILAWGMGLLVIGLLGMRRQRLKQAAARAKYE